MRRDARGRVVVDVMLSYKRDMLGPVECSGFSITVDARFAPGGEKVELGCGNVELASVIQMILNAESATVDLRCTDLQQFDEFGLYAGFAQCVTDRGHAGAHLGDDALKDRIVDSCVARGGFRHRSPQTDAAVMPAVCTIATGAISGAFLYFGLMKAQML